MNYFEFYGLPESFSIDEAALKKKFYALSKKYHPDFYANEDEAKQQEILELSTINNKAYNVLSNANKRMEYVLQQHNLLAEGDKYQLAPDFLMEMMELNEDLSSQSAKQIEALCTTLHNEVKQLIDQYVEDITPETSLLKLKEYYYKNAF